MASIFCIHTEKENLQTSDHLTKKGLKNPNPIFITQPNKTPRRALGDVNEVHRVGSGKNVKRSQTVNPCKDATPSLNELKKKNVGKEFKAQQQASAAANRAKKTSDLSEIISQLLPSQDTASNSDELCIEYMPPPSLLHDTDKDDDYMFLPMKDRASTYVQRCSIWRHPSLFGITVESDKEEHQELELIRRHLTDSQLAISVNDGHVCNEYRAKPEVIDMQGIPVPCDDDALVSIVEEDEDNAIPLSV